MRGLRGAGAGRHPGADGGDRLTDRRRGERLGNEHASPRPDRPLDHLRRAVGGHRHDRQALPQRVATKPLDEGKPVHDRHVEIDRHHVRSDAAGEDREPLLSVPGLIALVPQIDEHLREDAPHRLGIVDDQGTQGLSHGFSVDWGRSPGVTSDIPPRAAAGFGPSAPVPGSRAGRCSPPRRCSARPGPPGRCSARSPSSRSSPRRCCG